MRYKLATSTLTRILDLQWKGRNKILFLAYPEHLLSKITQCIEDDNRVTDLHLWSISLNIYGAIISVVTRTLKPPEDCKELIPSNLGLVHLTVKVTNGFKRISTTSTSLG